MSRKRKRSQGELPVDDVLQDSAEKLAKDEEFEKNVDKNPDFALLERCLASLLGWLNRARMVSMDGPKEASSLLSEVTTHSSTEAPIPPIEATVTTHSIMSHPIETIITCGFSYRLGFMSKSEPTVDLWVQGMSDALLHSTLASWLKEWLTGPPRMGKMENEEDNGWNGSRMNDRSRDKRIKFKMSRAQDGALMVDAMRRNGRVFRLMCIAAHNGHSSLLHASHPLSRQLESTFEKYANLGRSVILLKKWASTRFLARHPILDDGSYAETGVNDFTLAVLASHVCLARNLSHDITAFQAFKAVLHFVAKMDTDGMYVYGDMRSMERRPSMENQRVMATECAEGTARALYEILGHYILRSPVMVHASAREENLLGDLSVTFPQLQFHASETLQLLKGTDKFTLDRLFTTQLLKSELYDAVIFIPLDGAARPTEATSSPMMDSPGHSMQRDNHNGSFQSPFWPSIPSSSEADANDHLARTTHFILRYGLRDRMRYIHIYPATRGIMACIAYNEGIQRLTDVGPPTESPEAAFYRKFWGSKAETRRFDDGSINECVLWTNVNLKRKSTCVERALVKDGPNSLNSRIVDHILKRHSGPSIPTTHSPILTTHSPILTTHSPILTTHSEFIVTAQLLTKWRSELMRAYNELNGNLRSLESIPLKILNVTMADEYFAYSDVGPTAYGMDTFHNINITLESSTAWPAEREAIKRVKIAFLIAISNELGRRFKWSSKVTDEAQLEVQIGTFCFVLNIVHMGRLNLHVGKPHYNPHVDKKPTREELREIRTWYRGIHTNRIRNVALMHPAYSDTVRLAKLWASRCLVDHPDFLCEVMCAHIFLRKSYAPTSASTAFSQFLNLLVTHPWENEALVYHNEWSGGRNVLATNGSHNDHCGHYGHHYGHYGDHSEDHSFMKKSYPGAPFTWIYTAEDPFAIMAELPSRLLCKRFIAKSRQLLEAIEERYSMATQKSIRHLYGHKDTNFDLVLAMHNPYISGVPMPLSPQNMMEARFLIRECIRLLEERMTGICTIAHDHCAASGMAYPEGLDGWAKGARSGQVAKPRQREKKPSLTGHPFHIPFHVKFNPFGFIPTHSIHPKSFPQCVIAFKEHKDAMGTENRLLSPQKALLHSRDDSEKRVAIPNFALVMQEMLGIANGLLSHVMVY